MEFEHTAQASLKEKNEYSLEGPIEDIQHEIFEIIKKENPTMRQAMHLSVCGLLLAYKYDRETQKIEFTSEDLLAVVAEIMQEACMVLSATLEKNPIDVAESFTNSMRMIAVVHAIQNGDREALEGLREQGLAIVGQKLDEEGNPTGEQLEGDELFESLEDDGAFNKPTLH